MEYRFASEDIEHGVWQIAPCTSERVHFAVTYRMLDAQRRTYMYTIRRHDLQTIGRGKIYNRPTAARSIALVKKHSEKEA